MKKTRFNRFLRTITTVVLMLVLSFTLTGCPKPPDGPSGNKTDAIVLMSEELSGLYNPFYATSGSDQDVVGMTQIGMLSTNRDGKPVAGDNEPTVVKDFQVVSAPDGSETVYTFIIKNGLKFSDGKPLTMNDVIFNMYEYLDPVYTGSSTMYSTRIKGLTQYRTQTNYSDGGSEQADSMSQEANDKALVRVYELVDVYKKNAETPSGSYNITEANMRKAIENWNITAGYKDAVANKAQQEDYKIDDYRKILTGDYDLTLKKYRTELENDYKTAKDAFDLTTAPYQEWASKFNADNGEIFKFFLYEGYIKPDYRKDQGKIDRTKIEKFDGEDLLKYYTTQEKAIDKVYNDAISSNFIAVLLSSGTANELFTEYAAAGMDIILHDKISENGGERPFPNIEGIVSLGHTTTTQSVKVNGTDYKVAQAHNADGTPKNADEYDVLQITVEGTDPKAIYNFGFTVAPAHYYTADADHPNGREIDIANNKFGVEYGDAKFQSDVIQSLQHVEVPVGAGAYQASNVNNDSNPKGSDFVNSNVVYYKRNDNFMFPVKTEKLRMQVVSASNAIDKLVSGEVHYVTPQFTKDNDNRLVSLKDAGYLKLSAWQLGYGYIGINAGKVKNIYVRRAIMSAMQTDLAKEFYAPGTCETIDWPMSKVNWAYPYEDDGKTSMQNGHDYTQWTGKEAAKKKIRDFMRQAGVSEGDPQLKITFTIAGASITEHPTYPVFKQAAEILNECGWDVEVKPDSQALTKLATGSLAVWAAAWGSTIDPDMYQVYHKNSKATSVYSWGYREILNDTENIYGKEQELINLLSGKIDDGRETMVEGERIRIYREAMGYVLDLAVEMPVYQRMTLYAYNSNVIKGLQTDVNPYSSPLEKVWELELV